MHITDVCGTTQVVMMSVLDTDHHYQAGQGLVGQDMVGLDMVDQDRVDQDRVDLDKVRADQMMALALEVSFNAAPK